MTMRIDQMLLPIGQISGGIILSLIHLGSVQVDLKPILTIVD